MVNLSHGSGECKKFVVFASERSILALRICNRMGLRAIKCPLSQPISILYFCPACGELSWKIFLARSLFCILVFGTKQLSGNPDEFTYRLCMFSDSCLKYLFLRKTKGEKQSLEIGPGRENERDCASRKLWYNCDGTWKFHGQNVLTRNVNKRFS